MFAKLSYCFPRRLRDLCLNVTELLLWRSAPWGQVVLEVTPWSLSCVTGAGLEEANTQYWHHGTSKVSLQSSCNLRTNVNPKEAPMRVTCWLMDGWWCEALAVGIPHFKAWCENVRYKMAQLGPLDKQLRIINAVKTLLHWNKLWFIKCWNSQNTTLTHVTSHWHWH